MLNECVYVNILVGNMCISLVGQVLQSYRAAVTIGLHFTSSHHLHRLLVASNVYGVFGLNTDSS